MPGPAIRLSAGQVFNRTHSKIYSLPASEIVALEKNGYIRMQPNIIPPTYSISIQGLCEIARQSRTSLRWIFFGDENYIPTYTPYDGEFISFLNGLPAHECENFFRLLKGMYPCPLYDAGEYPSPHKKLSMRMNGLPMKLQDLMGMQPAYKQFQNPPEQVHEQIMRYVNGRRAAIAYPTDFLADLCTVFGVSLRWLIGAKDEMFCATPLADDIFSYFVMLFPEQQETIIRRIRELRMIRPRRELFPTEEKPYPSLALAEYCKENIGTIPYGQKDAEKWLFGNIKAILLANRERALIVLKTPPTEAVSETANCYCPASCFDALDQRMIGSRQVVRPAVLANVFCATHYPELSAHYMVFGENRPIELFPEERVLVTEFMRSKHPKQEKILAHLLENEVKCNNPAYTLRQRAATVFHANSAWLENDIIIPKKLVSTTLDKEINDFRYKEFEPFVADPFDEFWNTGTAGLVLAIRLCVVHDIPIDYFLMRDYSRYATLHGFPLTGLARKFLSAYLCASPDAQDYAWVQLVSRFYTPFNPSPTESVGAES